MEWVTAIKTMPVWADIAVPKQILQSRSKSPQARGSGSTSSSSSAAITPEVIAVHTSPPRSKEQDWQVTAFIIASQASSSSASGDRSSRVKLRIVSLPEARTGGALKRSTTGKAGWTLNVSIPEYNVERSGYFHQVLVGSGGLGMLLLAEKCCAVVSLPDLTEKPPGSELTAFSFVLLPPEHITYVKVLWHPLSDGHCGVLLSNGDWQLLDLRHRSDASVEVHITVNFGSRKHESVADFAFAGPGCSAGGAAGAWAKGASEAVWLAVTVLFLSTTGKVSIYCPVLPGLAVFPQIALDVLRANTLQPSAEVHPLVSEWLQKTLLCEGSYQQLPSVPGCETVAMVSVRHALHLQANSEEFGSRWAPSVQVLQEEGILESRSPRERRYCSVHFVAQAPVTVIVRAACTGVLEVLIVNAGIEPRFQASDELDDLASSLFEEVDLNIGQPVMSIQMLHIPSWCGVAQPGFTASTFLATTSTLVAAVDLSWLRVLLNGADAPDSLPSSKVITIEEVEEKSTRVGVGFQLCTPPLLLGAKRVTEPVDLVALWLQAQLPPQEGSSSSRSKVETTARVLDISARVAASTFGSEKSGEQGGRVLKAGHEASLGGASEDHKQYLRYLRVPPLLGKSHIKDVFAKAMGEKNSPPAAIAVVQAVADAHEGCLAELLSRQVVLKHLVKNAPQRASAVAAELRELQAAGKEVAKHAEEAQRVANRISERQKELVNLQATVVGALADEVEKRELDRIAAEEMPGLWTRMATLRRSLEELRLASVSLDDMNEASKADLDPRHLASLEALQRSWTNHSTEQLSALAAEAEAAVSKVVQQSAGAFPMPTAVKQPVKP
mmetsp:Transcript_2544/g.6443  ORF Transcript_2544/g.6443 Transcript_2544/m.6443 type:complete len:838 (-) Transcript_2544:33-2546(-)